MCLSCAAEFKHTHIGYKVVSKQALPNNQVRYYTILAGNSEKHLPEGKWLASAFWQSRLDEECTQLRYEPVSGGSFTPSKKTYPVGWHVFTTWIDAAAFRHDLLRAFTDKDRYAIVKVSIKDVVQTGKQWMHADDEEGVKVIVCRQIKILSEVDGGPGR